MYLNFPGIFKMIGDVREPQDVPVIELESETLKASVTTQWGGKVWSLYHKKFDRELFFANPHISLRILDIVRLGRAEDASGIGHRERSDTVCSLRVLCTLHESRRKRRATFFACTSTIV